MIRVIQFVIAGCLAAVVIGCEAQDNRPVWEQVKIGDLAGLDTYKDQNSQSLKTINFDITIFEIPAGNIDGLDKARQMLYSKPLYFNNYAAFRANSFSAGFGRGHMYRQLTDLLTAAKGRKVQTTSLLLPHGQADSINIARFRKQQTIWYYTSYGALEGTSVGSGSLTLRIRAEKIPAARGSCTVYVLPAFQRSTAVLIPQLAKREKSCGVAFNSLGIKLTMTPGDFVLLGPEKYISNEATLAGMFFSRLGRKPIVSTYNSKAGAVINLYLIACTRID